ncbi:hypothetical protein IN07_01255 [Modestobacter caceresii]|uniref:Uncharacterized protein n=1 Tax=Modestobacter caceresii TaxID=1522368 RepID=A0A098YDQ3_9ACTN|nr:hypothetical protein [Modestobacter caceresii]KGH48619.1 hypothetical protein IN07_01255 [Modestobacter caceresii]
MSCGQLERLARGEQRCGDVWQRGRETLCAVDVSVESDHAGDAVVLHRLEDSDGCGTLVASQHVLSDDELRALLELLPDGVVRDADDDDLVVAQEFSLDGLREAEAVHDWPVEGLVVHRRGRRALRQPWGGGHEDPLRGVDAVAIQDEPERCCRLSGGAMSLVGQRQVEGRCAHRLGSGDHERGVVRGEHHRPASAPADEVCGEDVRVSGDRCRDVGGRG